MDTSFFQVDSRLAAIADQVDANTKDVFARIDEISTYNQQKVLSAYIRHRVSESHFVPTTG